MIFTIFLHTDPLLEDDYFYIVSIEKNLVLGATSDGKVILEGLEEGKVHQLWKKGELDAEDYFILENSGVPKVLTAISESSLEIKGNITMRWILLVNYLLIIYHVVFLHTDHCLFNWSIGVWEFLKSPEKETLEIRLEKDETKKMIQELKEFLLQEKVGSLQLIKEYLLAVR